MRQSLAVFLPILVYLINSVNAQGGQTCNATSKCSSSSPCCSEFGFCGSDTFCLGGCNPFNSYDPTSCRPNPVCQDATHVFQDNSRILANATYFDGNASAYDWVVDKGNIMNTNSSGGELVSSSPRLMAEHVFLPLVMSTTGQSPLPSKPVDGQGS